MMKRAFPSLIIFITASLAGLMFLQMYWIQNAMMAQKGKYSSDVENSFWNIKTGLKTKVASTLGMMPASINWDAEDMVVVNVLWGTLNKIPTDDIVKIIRNELGTNDIDLDFEFAITENQLFINNSPGFTQEMIPLAYQKSLTYDGAFVFYLFIKEPKNYILSRTTAMIGTSIAFTTIILIAFALTVRTLFRQKQLSEISSDFINNMTHEFKTPLATISLAVDALGYEKVIHSPEQIKYYTGIIKEENSRMHKQVEKILEAARTDSSSLDLTKQKVDIHELIKNAAANIVIRIAEGKGDLDLNLNAKSHIIEVDEVHFSNIITNLLDNAIKYSRTPIKISVSTSNPPMQKMLTIKIKDNGIGMSKETMNHIFERFFRAHTGNIHNVKGFGLGLSYVKSVVEAHGGKIKVESAPGKGSTFQIDIPLNH